MYSPTEAKFACLDGAWRVMVVDARTMTADFTVVQSGFVGVGFGAEGQSVRCVRSNGMLFDFDSATGALIREVNVGLVAGRELSQVRFSQDGLSLAAVSDERVLMIDLQSMLNSYHGKIHLGARVFFSDDLALYAVVDGEFIDFYKIEDGSRIVHTEATTDFTSSIVAFCKTDGVAAVSIGKGYLKFYDMATGKYIRFLALAYTDIEALTFSPDGRHIVVGGSHGSVEVICIPPHKCRSISILRGEGERRAGNGHIILVAPNNHTIISKFATKDPRRYDIPHDMTKDQIDELFGEMKNAGKTS